MWSLQTISAADVCVCAVRCNLRRWRYAASHRPLSAPLRSRSARPKLSGLRGPAELSTVRSGAVSGARRSDLDSVSIFRLDLSALEEVTLVSGKSRPSPLLPRIIGDNRLKERGETVGFRCRRWRFCVAVARRSRDRRSCSTSSPVSAGMGDPLYRLVTGHSAQLSLAVPSWVGRMASSWEGNSVCIAQTM